MKKLFALALIAGSLSFFACNNEGTDADGDNHDTVTNVENNTTNVENTTTVDTAHNNMGDTAKTGTDTTMKK